VTSLSPESATPSPHIHAATYRLTWHNSSRPSRCGADAPTVQVPRDPCNFLSTGCCYRAIWMNGQPRRSQVTGSDEVRRRRVENRHSRGLVSVFGPVRVTHKAYRAAPDRPAARATAGP